MLISSRLHRPLAAAALGAALLLPLQPLVTASAAPHAAHATASVKPKVRATQATLTAYGDTDSAGTVHLTGSVRWANGKVLGHKQHVELWGKSGRTWTLVQKALTDKHGDVELGVVPTARTTYQLRYAGSRSSHLSAAAGPSVSPRVEVRAVARVTLAAPTRVKPRTTFVVTGKVSPAGAGRVVTLTGDTKTYATLRTRADGSFSAHVRLRQTTTLTVHVATGARLDGASSAPRVVRVA